MAIFIYCEECDKCVEPNSCIHKAEPRAHEDTGKFINMRKTWSGQTKMEFSTTTMDDLILKGNNK